MKPYSPTHNVRQMPPKAGLNNKAPPGQKKDGFSKFLQQGVFLYRIF